MCAVATPKSGRQGGVAGKLVADVNCFCQSGPLGQLPPVTKGLRASEYEAGLTLLNLSEQSRPAESGKGESVGANYNFERIPRFVSQQYCTSAKVCPVTRFYT